MGSIETHYCRNCGKEFLTRDINMEFCNLGCKQKYLETTEDRYLERTCLHCGKVFKKKYVHQKYCCVECCYKHQKIFKQIALDKIRNKEAKRSESILKKYFAQTSFKNN